MSPEQKLKLLEELTELERFSNIGYVTFQQLKEQPALYRCSNLALFPEPVTRAEAQAFLTRYTIAAVFFTDQAQNPEPVPEGMYVVDFTD